jgi:hypothetical protein
MVSGVASLLAVCLSLYTLLTARNHKDVADLIEAKDEHAARLVAVESNVEDVSGLIEAKDEHAARLVALESKVEHLPETETVHRLELSITKMEGQLAVIVERVGPIKAIAERLQENFLEHGR